MSKRSRRFAAGAAVAILGACLAAYWRSGVNELSNGLEAEREAAWRERIPINAEQLRLRLRELKGRNAAPYLLAAARYLDASKVRATYRELDVASLEWKLGPIGPAIMTPLRLKMARHLVNDHRSVWRALEQAATCETLDFNRNWDLGFDLTMPESTSISKAINRLVDRAALESEDGDPVRAFDTLDSAARVGALLRHDPTSLGMFRRMRLEGPLLRTATSVLSRHPDRPNLIARARGVLERLGPPSDPRWCRMSEAAQLHDIGRAARAQYGVGPLAIARADDPWQAMLGLESVGRANQTAWLRHYREAQSAYAGDLNDAESILKAAARFTEYYPGPQDLNTVLLSVIYPLGLRDAQAVATFVARRRVFASGLARLERRFRTDSPTKSPRAGREDTDPFTGRPFYFARRGDGFLLASVGYLQPQRWRPDMPEEEIRPDDVVFEYVPEPRP